MIDWCRPTHNNIQSAQGHEGEDVELFLVDELLQFADEPQGLFTEHLNKVAQNAEVKCRRQ